MMLKSFANFWLESRNEDWGETIVNKYIALFRGINVGGRNILPMKALVRVLEGVGCENVRTYIQSGNAVFQHREQDVSKITSEIGTTILETHGFEPKVLLLELRELREAIANNPFSTDNGKVLHFFFLSAVPDNPDLDKLAARQANSETFKLDHNVFYLHAPAGIGRSKLAANVEQSLGVPATARNWNTVKKLMAMVESL